MKVYYLPVSSSMLSEDALRESMRRWHWHRYFHYLRVEKQWLRCGLLCSWRNSRTAHQRALYHRKLAESIQKNAPR